MNRPDISQFLAHFTSNKFPKGFKDPDSPEKRLISILEGRKIIASQMPWIGKHNAVCFTECPWASLITHTQQMMNDAKVKEGQEQVREKQSFVTAGPSEWGPLSVINPKNWKMAPQFIGTYTYYGAPSADGQHINNVIFDSKNVRSLFLHIPRGSWNKRRSEYTQRFGNTYQFYIWQSLK